MPNGQEPTESQLPRAGWVNDLVNAIFDRFLEPDTNQEIRKFLTLSGWEMLDIAVKWWALGAGEFMLLLSKSIGRGEGETGELMGRLFEDGVADLFGIQVDASGFGVRGDSPRALEASRRVGESMIVAITGGRALNSTDPIVPTLDPAREYLALIMRWALEGWLFGVQTAIIPIGVGAAAGELDDVVGNTLGLGRMTRRIMGPILDAMVTTPAQWEINRTFQSRLVSPAQAARQLNRGQWTREAFDFEMAIQGYNATRSAVFVNEAQRFLGTGDLNRAVTINVWTREQALQHLRDQGYTEEVAETLLTLERARIREQFENQLGGAAVSAYVSRDIERGEFVRLLDASVTDLETRNRLTELGEIRRVLNLKRISEGRVKRMVLTGLLTRADYRRFLEREGFVADDIILLELELNEQVRNRTEADAERKRLEAERKAEQLAEKEADRKKQEELETQQVIKRPALATVRKGYVRGLIPLADFRAFLIEQGYQGDDLALLIGLAEEERAAVLAQQEERAAREGDAQLRGLSLGQLERAVIEGLLSEADYRARLESLNFGAEAVDVLTALLRDKIEQRDEAEEARRRASAELAERGISLGDFETSVKRGLRTVDAYDRFLSEENFSLDARALMVALLRDELADLDTARAKRADAGTRAKTRQISLGDFELAVKRGVRTIGQYQELLATLGFGPEDQQLMTTLFQLELDDLAAAAAQRAEAEAAAEERRRQREEEATERARRAAEPPPPKELSLGQMQKAVTLGVITLPIFRQYLDRQNLRPEDREVLVQLLLVDLEKVQRDRERRGTLDGELRVRGLGLGQFERAVKKRIRTIQQYATFVAAQGFSADDQELLVRLLQLELDQQTSAEERRAELIVAFAARGFDLERAEQLVLEGEATFDDFVAFLTEEGVTPEDIALLIQLVLIRQQTAEPIPGEES